MRHPHGGGTSDSFGSLGVDASLFCLRAILLDEGEGITFRAEGSELMESQPAHLIFKLADLEPGSFAYYVIIDKIYINL